MYHDYRLRARMMELAEDLAKGTQRSCTDPTAVEKLAIQCQELDAILKVILIRVHDQALEPYDPAQPMIDKLRDNGVVTSHRHKMDAWVQQANARRNRGFQERMKA